MISKERVNFNLKATTKNEVIEELIDLLEKDGKITDKREFKEVVFNREGQFSTGIGMGVAIPHGKSSTVKEASIVFGKSEKGIDYESVDGKPAHLFFLIAVPKESVDTHLKILSNISRRLIHSEVREQLLKAQNFEELTKVLDF